MADFKEEVIADWKKHGLTDDKTASATYDALVGDVFEETTQTTVGGKRISNYKLPEVTLNERLSALDIKIKEANQRGDKATANQYQGEYSKTQRFKDLAASEDKFTFSKQALANDYAKNIDAEIDATVLARTQKGMDGPTIQKIREGARTDAYKELSELQDFKVYHGDAEDAYFAHNVMQRIDAGLKTNKVSKADVTEYTMGALQQSMLNAQNVSSTAEQSVLKAVQYKNGKETGLVVADAQGNLSLNAGLENPVQLQRNLVDNTTKMFRALERIANKYAPTSGDNNSTKGKDHS